jgi:hypothetical protein
MKAGLASFIVSVPVPAWRPVPVSVRNDTVSVGGPVPAGGLRRGPGDAHGVVSLLVSRSGCGAMASLAACNTGRPWLRVPGAAEL